MNTETKNAILITDKDAQYDERAKRLLGQKSILAHILVKTVDEFMGMNPKDVILQFLLVLVSFSAPASFHNFPSL